MMNENERGFLDVSIILKSAPINKVDILNVSIKGLLL